MDCMDIWEEQIQHLSTLGDIIILGDINARTANNLDYVCNDTDEFIHNVMPYISDNDMPSRKRIKIESIINVVRLC